MELLIKVTKDVLQKTINCGYNAEGILDFASETAKNCAISYAVRDVFPDAATGTSAIYPFYYKNWSIDDPNKINLPLEAIQFISLFDRTAPNKRMEIPEMEFTIDIPDEVLEQIDITEITELLKTSETLQLV